MAVDVSAFTYFAPLLSFLIVLVLMAAFLYKTETLGKNIWLIAFVSFLIAAVFVAAGSVRQVVLDVIPWFAVLLLAMFFMFVLIKFVGADTKKFFGGGVGWLFVTAIIVLFVVAGVKVFSSVFYPYLPGPYYGQGADPQLLYFLSWVYSPPVFGAGVIIIIGALVSWFLARSMKEGGGKDK